MKKYYVYMVRTITDKLYTGISVDPKRRLHEHNLTKRGAKALRGQRPVRLVWVSNGMNKSSALKLEYSIKKTNKEEKEKIITEVVFNPKLTEWLNTKDYVSGDWPHNISVEIKTQADDEFAPSGFILDENGWPIV